MAKRTLSLEIVAALAFKMTALAILFFMFFNGPKKSVVTPSEMATFLASNHSASR